MEGELMWVLTVLAAGMLGGLVGWLHVGRCRHVPQRRIEQIVEETAGEARAIAAAYERALRQALRER